MLSIKVSQWALVVFIASLAKAQTEEELLKTLETTPAEYHDSIYYELFKVSRLNDHAKAKMYASRSLGASSRFNNKTQYAKACRAIAFCYSSLHQLDSAMYYYYKGIMVARSSNINEPLLGLLIDTGVLYDKQDRYDSAFKYYQLALETANILGARDGQAAIANNIGLIFYYMGNYEKALEYLKRAMTIRQENAMQEDSYGTMLNIAILYYEQGRYDDALSILDEVSEYCENKCDIGERVSLTFGLALSYLKKGSYEKSLAYLIECSELSEKSGNSRMLAYSKKHLSELRFLDQDFEGAIKILYESEKIASEINLKRLSRDNFENYIKIYERLGDLRKVNEYQKRFMGMKESIFNEQVAFNIAVLQLEAQKKQSDLVIQQKEAELARSRLIIAFVVVVTVLALVLALLLYNRYRLNKRLKQILDKQVKLRTSDLVHSNQELKQLNTEFEVLLNQTSKYVRGPLATLMGLIELAEKDQDDPERTREYILKIKKVAGSMGLSLDQLKEVGKVRSKQEARKEPVQSFAVLLDQEKD